MGITQTVTFFLHCDDPSCGATIGPASYTDRLLARAANAAWSIYEVKSAPFGYVAYCPHHNGGHSGPQGASQEDTSGEMESSWGGSQEEQ